MTALENAQRDLKRTQFSFACAYLRDLLRGRPEPVAVAGDEPEPTTDGEGVSVDHEG